MLITHLYIPEFHDYNACCGNYKGIKLMSHTMKVRETIIKAKLKDRVEISKQQYGFMPGKETTDTMFALRMLM